MTFVASTFSDAALEDIRSQFPVLHQQINGHPLVYLDNAASNQKPLVVIEAMRRLYEEDYANIHRGVHTLSQRSTHLYEKARGKVQKLLGASHDSEIVFTRGTTEAINLVAYSFVSPQLQAGDEILISGMEHHSNIVPWQLICEQKGARLVVSPINDRGEISLDDLVGRISSRTKLLAVAHVSNALGTVNPVAQIVEAAHKKNVPVLIDGAQAVAHIPVNVTELDVDFYAFSGHKLYGPTGIGALYGKKEHLEAMPPWQGGGDMIRSVTFEKTTFAPPPARFEAGTPAIAEAIGLGVAMDWLCGIGVEAAGTHEHALLQQATERLRKIPGLRLIGEAEQKSAVLSFVLDGTHPHDVGTILDSVGVAIRAGHHCAQPVMQHFGIPATVRASFAAYNTVEDIDALVQALDRVRELFG